MMDRVIRRILIEGLSGEPAAVLLEADRIVALGPAALAAGESAARVHADGLRAVPGFIELQVNGVGDADVTSDPASLWRIAERLVAHGVTAFLPTIVSAPPGSVEAGLRALAASPTSTDVIACPLGIHVEGPYLAAARRGAHEERHLRPPDLGELREWIAGGARLITLAPELPGGRVAIERIVADGAVAAIGHTEADAATTTDAVDAGVRYATHLFNAMPPLHHRSPGAVGALLDDSRVTIGLIADGGHVDPILLRLAARLAPERLSIVSDAVGERLGDVAVDGSDAGRLPDGTLAGASRLLDDGVRTFVAATGSVESAILAVTAVPARLLGLDDGRGFLRTGGRADVVLLDETLRVAATVIGGRPAYLDGRISWP
jgi:N-acetylglucosamine-6-phosphate deacetylase